MLRLTQSIRSHSHRYAVNHNLNILSLSRMKGNVRIINPTMSFSSFHTNNSNNNSNNNNDHLSKAFVQLDSELRKRNTPNTQIILELLQSITKAKVLLPVQLARKCVFHLAENQKYGELEDVIALFRSNIHAFCAKYSSPGGFPSTETPLEYSKLVSFGLRSLIRLKRPDRAMNLWAKCASTGFAADRSTLENMIRTMSAFDYSSNNTFSIVKKIHDTVQMNLWANSPIYYSWLLKCWEQAHYHQHTILKMSNDDILAALETYSQWCREAEGLHDAGLTNGTQIVLRAQRLRCDVVAHTLSRRLLQPDSTHHEQLVSQLAERVQSTYGEVIASSKTKGAVDQVEKLLTSMGVGSSAGTLSEVAPINSLDSLSSAHYDAQNALYARQRAVHSAILQSAAFGNVDDCLSRIELYIASVKDSLPSNHVSDLGKSVTHEKNDISDVQSDQLGASTKNAHNLDGDGKHVTFIEGNVDSFFSAQSTIIGDTIGTNSSSAPNTNLRRQFGAYVGLSLTNKNEIREKWSIGNDREFLSVLFVDVLRNCFKNNTFALGPSETRMNQVDKLAEKLLDLAAKHHVRLNVDFRAAWIAALVPVVYINKTLGANLPRTDRHSAQLHSKFLSRAKSVIDRLDPELREVPYLHDAVITGLCRCEDPRAISTALEYAVQLLPTESNRTTSLPLDSWAALLYASSQWNNLQSHTALVSTVERSVAKFYRHGRNNLSYQIGLLYANARLGNGLSTLQILRHIRAKNKVRIDRQTYTWVINGMYHSRRLVSQAETTVVQSPAITAAWLVEVMTQDGIEIDAIATTALLKLFGRRAMASRARAELDKTASEQAVEFVNARRARKQDQGTSESRNAMVKELIKVCCLDGNIDLAERYINPTILLKEFNLPLTSELFEPIIYYFAKRTGNLNRAEDLITNLTNQGLVPTTNIIDAYFQGMLDFLNAPDREFDTDIIDWLQAMYTQYDARPSPDAVLGLLDHYLTNKDESEAKRVIMLIEQLYTTTERQDCVVIDRVTRPQAKRTKQTPKGDTSGTASESTEGNSTASNASQVNLELITSVPMYQSRLKSGLMNNRMSPPSGLGHIHREALTDRFLREKFATAGLHYD